MNIILYQDNTINVNFNCIITNFRKLAPELKLIKGKAQFSIEGSIVSSPKSYNDLSPEIDTECNDSDLIFLSTSKMYDNNYFCDNFYKKSIVSFSGWEHLTDVPINNGAVYFICAILIRVLNVGIRHDENTGCINDYWMDKTGIDIGMKAGIICPKCMDHYKNNTTSIGDKLLPQITAILHELSIASQDNMDICKYWQLRSTQDNYDVFLCHNSEDKTEIREMNTRLKEKGIRTWLDEEQLPPGCLWQDVLEEQIPQIKTAAVIVGQSGVGPWQHMEIRIFLQEFIRRRCPVIPVILQDCVDVPKLPLFLNQLVWVDFRKKEPEPFSQLLWGIKGKKM
ncbi:MAG: toll/interleukin-1 receptor domain-containing protein [candidate division Zixibacteria bacterium]